MLEEQPMWVQVGDNTLHGAIDYWQERAIKAENQLEEAFEAGWCVATAWAQEDHLLADVGSPAYLADRAEALAKLLGEQNE